MTPHGSVVDELTGMDPEVQKTYALGRRRTL
jgi:hypothetical protein